MIDTKTSSFLFNKSYSKIEEWKIDKMTINEKNRVTKVEVYNYFKLEDLEEILILVKSKKFKFTSDPKKFPRLWNIILNQEGKYIISKGMVIDIEIWKPRYYYLVLLSRVLIHRGRPILIKVYWNISMNKQFFKLELTYSYFHKTYNVHYLDWLNALKSMNEIITKIEKEFTSIGFGEDFSGKIEFNALIHKMLLRFQTSRVNHRNNILKKITRKNLITNGLKNEK